MNILLDVDWRALFVPTVPLLEAFVRGSLTYLALFVTMRFLLKRQTGVIGIADLLVIVLIAVLVSFLVKTFVDARACGVLTDGRSCGGDTAPTCASASAGCAVGCRRTVGEIESGRRNRLSGR